MNKKKKYIVWFDQAHKESPVLVGDKGTSLGELNTLDLSVPKGFVVTADVFSSFLKKNQLSQQIKNALKTCNFNNPEEIKETAFAVQRLITLSPIPNNLGFRIAKAYEGLDGLFKDSFVAVRSSAASFLNIKGDANLTEAVRNCWASFFTPQMILERKKKKLSHFKINASIVVQKMIAADISGTIFTIDPVSKSKASILVEAIFGLGELAAQGKAKPDRYWVERTRLEIIKKELNKQELQIKRVGNSNQKINIPLEQQTKQKLSDTKIIELVKLGKIIHQRYFFPQNIEWAMRGNSIYILQTRKIE